MKVNENLTLSPISTINSKFKSDEDNTNINSDIYFSPKLKDDPKKNNFNNILSNRFSTNETYRLSKNVIIEEENHSYIGNEIEEKKEEIIKRDPIITKVTLTKFYPKSTKNKNINKLELAKKAINTVRNSTKNNLDEKLKNINNIKNNNNIDNLKLKNNEIKINNNKEDIITDNDNNNNDNPNLENILNNYKNILKEIEAHENKKIKLKINYNENLEKINNNLNNLNMQKNSLFRKSKSKPNIIEEKNTSTNQDNTNNLNINYDKFQEIFLENENLKKENIILNNNIKQLNICIMEQKSQIENYKNNKKINEEQIKYLITLKESNIISNKDKDNIIEEMKNKINFLEKENIDYKQQIKNLNEIITFNKKEELNKNNNDYEQILNELQNLKILLSEKNNIIENLQNNNNSSSDEEKENNNMKNYDIEYQEVIDNLEKKLEIKDNEINKMQIEYQNIYDTLDKMKNDYENLYQKYNEQNDIIEKYIKKKNKIIKDNNNDKDDKDNEIDNKDNDIHINNLLINSDHINRTKNLLRNKKENNSINFNKFKDKKRNKSFENIMFSNNNIQTFYNYGNDIFKNLLKEKREINTERNDDDLNYFNNINNKKFLTPNRIKINNNKIKFPLNFNNPIKNTINYTSNNFYSKNKDIFKLKELTNTSDLPSQIITSSNENSNSNLKILADINFSEKSISKYPNIYTLMGAKIIGFNLKKKIFMLIKPIDETNNLFNENINILRQYNILPTTLNHFLGFFIILNNYLFFYSNVNNTLNTLAKLSTNHWSCGFISIKKSLYIISGIDTSECELYSLDSKNMYHLPYVNYKRINSGICNVNNEYIYTLFGRGAENTIERLNIGKIGGGENWELIRVKIDGGNEIYMNNLQQFLSFYNGESIVILGGDYNIKNENQEILRLNIKENCLNKIGFIDLKCLYLNHITFIDDEFFVVYDINNGLHFFNKDLDKHLIFNFQI